MQSQLLQVESPNELAAFNCLIRNDNKKEFNQLIEQLRPQLLRYCLMYLRDHDEAEEACQETLFKAYQSLNNFQGRSSLKTWIYKIAANVCATQYRKDQKRSESIDCVALDIEQEASESETRLDFNSVIGSLNSQERDVLYFRFKNDLQLNDIAAVLSLNLSTVKMCYYRALEKVKRAGIQ